MSSLALMRFLESAPQRYDTGMRLLTLGRVTRLHEALAEAAAPEPGARVLEIGCGTGTLTERLVARGASVTAIDQNPEMLEQARRRLAGDARRSVMWLERTAAEIDSFDDASFDAVVASLSLSEMGSSERAFVLRAALPLLRPGGRLVVGDEVRPGRPWQRAVRAAIAAPQTLLAWLLVDSASHPIADLKAEVRAAGFRIVAARRWLLGTLTAISAEPHR